jgi:hypothetical protein
MIQDDNYEIVNRIIPIDRLENYNILRQRVEMINIETNLPLLR